MRTILTSNEPRSAFLFEEIKRQSEVVVEVDFDDIDLLTKYVTALLSYDRPRSEWWQNYQMHSLMQRRRRKVLHRELDLAGANADALLMWGSWFHPDLGRGDASMPFFNYIDQSRSLAPLPGEPAASILRRTRSHQLQAETYNASSGIFCMSEWARRQTLDSHSVDASKVHAVGWGPCSVDLSEESIDDSRRERRILHVSNDFHRKGVDFLLEVSDRVAAVEPAIRFVVIGKDVGHGSYASHPNVEFLGTVRGRELEEQFRSASAFLLPHRFDRSPHVLVEAMSAGLPLVASAQGGAIELIDGRDTGFLVEVGDLEGYSNAIIALLGSETLRRRMGQNGKTLVRRQYNWPTIAKKILSLMATALSQRTRAVE